ncbi:MAG: hypothetical protein R3C31_15075 [Hyphomonadaceae bacterium]
MPNRLDALLMEIADLLRVGGHERWAVTFDRFRAQALADMVGAKVDILGVYGAAGSFNDIVLHREGHALLEENERLNAAREELWRLCRSSS